MSSSRPGGGDALSPLRIMELAWGFQTSRILLTACELELFTALGNDGATSAQIARMLHTDERATDRLMNALCAVGLLAKKEGLFSNTALTSRFLIKGTSSYVAAVEHVANLWDTWSTLTDAVRAGTKVAERPSETDPKKRRKAFIAAMHWFAGMRARDVIALLDLSNVWRVLDVGGGSGAYAMEFVRAKDGVTACVFDLPNIIPITQSYIADAGLTDRIDTATGDFVTDDLGSGFDLAFLSAVVHSNSPEENESLIRKSADAVNPGGQVVIQDFIMDGDRTSPPFGALFALNMLVNTEAGDTYTERQVRAWMEHAGLVGIERQDTVFGTTLITARKP